MNIEAITAAEKWAQNVLKLSPEKQDEYFDLLLTVGLSADDVRTLQEYVSLYHMFTDETHYKKMQKAVGMMLWETFNSERK